MCKYETITIEIPEDLLLELALMAHNRDMKLNDLITELLEKHVQEFLDERKEELRKEYNRNVEY